jgi:hypothetical protein
MYDTNIPHITVAVTIVVRKSGGLVRLIGVVLDEAGDDGGGIAFLGLAETGGYNKGRVTDFARSDSRLRYDIYVFNFFAFLHSILLSKNKKPFMKA